MKLSALLGTCAAGLLLMSGVSQAKDYCVDLNSVFIVVAPGFSIPAKGKCKAWVGFSAQDNLNSPSTGTGCTSSDGTEFSLMFTTAFPNSGSAYEEDQMTLSLPAQTGDDFSTGIEEGAFLGEEEVPASGGPCSKVSIPDSPAASADGKVHGIFKSSH